MQTIAVIASCCPPLLAEPLSRTDAEQLATPLKALADPARLRILSLIQAQPGGEACVCHLTAPLDLTQGTVSHHLRVLREAGLVERDRRGSWAYYRVVPEVARGAAQPAYVEGAGPATHTRGRRRGDRDVRARLCRRGRDHGRREDARPRARRRRSHLRSRDHGDDLRRRARLRGALQRRRDVRLRVDPPLPVVARGCLLARAVSRRAFRGVATAGVARQDRPRRRDAPLRLTGDSPSCSSS